MARYKLGEICEIVSGSTPKTDVAEYWDGTEKWITPAELNDESYIIYDSVRKLTELGVKKTGLTPFPEGTVILSSRAPIGKVSIAGCEMCCNQGFKNLICSDIINNRYLYWFLKGNTAYLNSLGRGATFKEISKQIVASIEINVPSQAEQLAAVKQLEKVTDVIRLRRAQLQKLDELVKARFVELFGGIHNSNKYPYKPIQELTDVIIGGTPNRDVNEYWECGTIPWVKTTELQNNLIKEVDESITKKGLNSSSAKLVPPGTVLIAMYGQGKTRGMTAYLNIEACTNQACACILPSDQINQTFLWKFLILSYDNLRGMAKGGNQPNLNGTIIKNYPILYPPIELQEQFAAFVEQTDKSKVAIQKALDEAQLLFDSLMQKYFGDGN
ncbi:MAG: restriction endonuclease subunit S [Clostridiales bacterium]|nr:restriction endonuclease subunit S [Clostridiales bacterium]